MYDSGSMGVLSLQRNGICQFLESIVLRVIRDFHGVVDRN